MIKFHKAHGLGNDFILTEKIDGVEYSKIAEKYSSRRLGIGFDQLILYKKADNDYDMWIYNADGTSAESCGNGTRCLAKLLCDKNNIKEIRFNTPAGKVQCKKMAPDLIAVQMPQAKISEINIPLKSDLVVKAPIYVEVGNPHLVCFVNSLDDLHDFGPILSRHPLFPNGTNVDFARVLEQGIIELSVYERGAGITPACGSGSCATSAAYNYYYHFNKPILVKQAGGDLEIEVKDDHILMQGPAAIVYEGSIKL